MTEISPKAYVAAAINQVRRVPGIEPGMKGREIAKVAIIGAGLMGSGIAVCFLGAGIPTVLVDKDEGALANGRKYVDGALNTLLKRGYSLARSAPTAFWRRFRGFDARGSAAGV